MIVIAHRGFSRRHPENTLPAIRAAIALGVDMVEIDVQQTRDGELVVFHDYRLDRIYGKRKRVRDSRRMPGMPTLQQVLRLNFPLLIEVKGADPRKISALVGNRRDVILFSIHPAKLRQLRAPRFGLAARNLKSKIRNLKCPVSGWALSRRIVSRAIVRSMHRRGFKVFVWTVNRPDEMRRLREWGVDGLITDRPDVALKLRKP